MASNVNQPTNFIECDEDVYGGRPCLAGTRIMPSLIYSNFMADVPVSEIMDEYDLTEEQVWAAIRFCGGVNAH